MNTMIDEVTRRLAIKNLETALQAISLAPGEEPVKVVCVDEICHTEPMTLERVLELMKTQPEKVEEHILIWAKYGGVVR